MCGRWTLRWKYRGRGCSVAPSDPSLTSTRPPRSPRSSRPRGPSGPEARCARTPWRPSSAYWPAAGCVPEKPSVCGAPTWSSPPSPRGSSFGRRSFESRGSCRSIPRPPLPCATTPPVARSSAMTASPTRSLSRHAAVRSRTEWPAGRSEVSPSVWASADPEVGEESACVTCAIRLRWSAWPRGPAPGLTCEPASPSCPSTSVIPSPRTPTGTSRPRRPC
jgi:hypothetical protein